MKTIVALVFVVSLVIALGLGAWSIGVGVVAAVMIDFELFLTAFLTFGLATLTAWGGVTLSKVVARYGSDN